MLEKLEKAPKPWQMGTHMIVPIKSLPLHAEMKGFKSFFQNAVFVCL